MPEHKLPPIQCPANTPTWTDPALTANTVKARNDHVEELRIKINLEFTRRGLSTATFTDVTLTADVIKIRNDHVAELRGELQNIKLGRGESGYCVQDASGCMDFTDPTLTANTIKARNDHVSELRTKLQALMTGCICEAEQCQYCADCGYYYQTCSHAGCACDDHKYSECGHSMIDHRICASYNLPGGTTHPYKAASGEPINATPWDGYIPWSPQCNYAPPGYNWGAVHSDWNCKCNPYTW